jgi:hypothetical protein
MHRAERFKETVMRVTATNGEEVWIYKFPEALWVRAASRIMHDARDNKIPAQAARGLLEMMMEAKSEC